MLSQQAANTAVRATGREKEEREQQQKKKKKKKSKREENNLDTLLLSRPLSLGPSPQADPLPPRRT